MHIEPNDIHIWCARLTLTPEQETEQFAILDSKERERALRFRFPIHKQRFIAAHYMVREILSLYLKMNKTDITFGFAEHDKPFIASPNPTDLQFNLSHSEDAALCAITLNHPIGVDIEKIQETVRDGIAERFFSAEENIALTALPQQEAVNGFFRVWSRKEAIVKAVGKGLSIPLSAFSVAATDTTESISLEDKTWTLLPLTTYSGYAAAVASTQSSSQLSYWTISNHTPVPAIGL